MLAARPSIVLLVAVAALACAKEPPECGTYRVAEVRANADVEQARAVLERVSETASNLLEAAPGEMSMAEFLRTELGRDWATAGELRVAAEVRLRNAENRLSEARAIRVAQDCSAPRKLEIQAATE